MAEIKIEDLYSKGGVPLQNQVQRNANDIASLKLDIRNTAGTPVLSTAWVQLRTSMWSGYVAADGQLLKRADYPDAWEAIEAGKVPVASDVDWLADPLKRGAFTTGDGSTTFRVPDYNGKFAGSIGATFLRGDGLNSGVNNGYIQGDAIRNITGTFAVGAGTGIPATGAPYTTGAFAQGGRSHTNATATNPAAASDVLFDASNVVPTAADNHPVNVTGCWAIKLFGAVQNAGEIDAAGLATQLAEAQSKIAELEQWPQSGSNANGSWIKYRDGTLECILPAQDILNVTISTAAGSLWYTGGGFKEWTLPMPFINKDIDASFGGHIAVTGATVPVFWSIPRSESVIGLYAGSSIKSDNSTLTNFRVRAVGRWK